jgi:hypothetical protein
LLAEQEWIVRPLRAYGTCTAVTTKGVLEVTVRRGNVRSRMKPGKSGAAAGHPGHLRADGKQFAGPIEFALGVFLGAEPKQNGYHR